MLGVYPMKRLVLFLSLSVILFGGCGGSERPEVTGDTGEAVAKKEEKTTESKEQEDESEKEPIKDDEKTAEEEVVEPTEDDKMLSFKEKIIKNHRSFWADAEVGDWVLYVTHNRQLALWTVIEVKKENGRKIVRFHKRWFYADGKEIPPTPDDKPYPDPIDVDKQTEDDRRSWSMPFVTMKEVDFVVPATGEKLKCLLTESMREERRSQNVYSRKIRCGGTVLTRLTLGGPAVTYVVLWDYGDKNRKPNLSLGIKKVTAHYMRYNVWWGEIAEGEEDPPGGEPPEPPED